ncbi:MAG TPA: hypothetical protein PK537_05605 [Candidatus Limiplasma sp.]|nr:hypothetical protein [Candidatus Limiplasma sp.]
MDRKHLEDHRERSQKEKLIEARDKLAKPLKSLASAILHKQGDHEPQEKDVAKSVDEKKLKVHADTIESLLRFSPSSSLVQGLETALQSAFNEYAALMGMQRKNELSEIVLNAFYKSNEILDLLKSIEAFIVSLDSISDPSVAYLMAFNNYVYFLRLSVEKMKAKYTQADQSPENADIACDPDTVNWFIQNECRQITAVRDLPKARRAAQRLTESSKQRELTAKEDHEDFAMVTEAIEYLHNPDTDYAAELQALQNSFAQRKAAIDAKYRKAIAIYDTVTACLTEEWFSRLDPNIESGPILTMSVAQIKTLYQNAMAGLQDIMQQEPTR